VLTVLDRDGPLTRSELLHRTDLPASTLDEALQRLRDANHVTREVVPGIRSGHYAHYLPYRHPECIAGASDPRWG
jgi:predicted transcriptional regulator